MNSPSHDPAAEPPAGRPRWRTEIIIASVCLALGLFLAPALIFVVGALLLGPYGDNQGVGAFYGDFFVDLARPAGRAWAIALGPLILVSALRLIFMGVRRPSDEAVSAPESSPPPARRAEARSRVEPKVTLE